MTLGDIGKRLRITRERVRQIEKIALRKLNKRLVSREEE
jgi:DNA-directed RNA polymerase sigma subunit (sigma70/sigma32)